MSQFQILGRRPFPFKAIPIRFAYTNFPDTIFSEPLFILMSYSADTVSVMLFRQLLR